MRMQTIKVFFLIENSISQKLKIELPYDPEIPLWVYILKKKKKGPTNLK